MSDDEDEVDWLAGQFTPTEQVPKQAVTPSAEPVAPVFPITAPTSTQAGAAAPSQPAASEPAHPAAAEPTQALPPTPSFVPASVPAAPPLIPVVPPVAAVVPPAVVPAAVVPPAPAPPALVPPPLVPPPVSSAPAATSAPRFSSAETPTEAYTPPAQDPTQPLSWDEFAATQASAGSPALPAPVWPGQSAGQATEAYTVQPWDPAPEPVTHIAPTPDPNDPTSAIDSLFAAQQFQQYEELGVLKEAQGSAPLPDGVVPESRPPREPLSSLQKTLMGVAGGLIAILILLGMFFLGQHIGAANATTPSASKTSGSTTVPKPAGTGGPASAGVQLWSALQGGECIQPFSSAWSATFTVVSCTSDHDAEMVFKGTLPDAADTAYPSTTSFQTEITPLCSASMAINYTAAAPVTDLQVSFSYPASESKWIAGDRTYYCFVDRVSGGNLPGDLAVAKS